VDGDHIDPKPQVFPEFSGSNQFGNVAVGGGDNAHIHGNGPVVPHPLELLGLQDAEQLHSDGERDVAIFIEKNVTAMGGLEAALAMAIRTGKGTLDMAKELTFQERFIQSRTVELDRGAVVSSAQFVDGARRHRTLGKSLFNMQRNLTVVMGSVEHP
jgi:hypothetical protein